MPSDQDYTVGWICALRKELIAAKNMLDGEPERQLGDGPDNNLYILGRIGGHNVVITCLPEGRVGTNTAATVATRIMGRFSSIKFGLMVGIGGGLPTGQRDIRLGDVVVSKPDGQYGGVVQYDLGKVTKDGFKRTGCLNAPPEKLLSVLNMMPEHGAQFAKKLSVPYPGEELDRLYDANYDHVGGNTCDQCDKQRRVERGPGKRKDSPLVYYGTILSGNNVIKEAATRDLLIQQHGVLCCETEAAGLMNTSFPCLVIRGISDYADSHKNDEWQDYAAAAAAQYAKELLSNFPTNVVADLKAIESVDSLHLPLHPKSSNTAAMPSSTLIFTSTPYAKDDVPLASLVPNKRYPNQDTLTEILVEEGRDFSVSLDKNFNGRIHMKSDSFFKATITRLLLMSRESETSCRFQVSADEGRIYLLRQPKALFKQLCARENVKKWLQDGYLDNQNTYFVVGYRTLLNAKLVCEDSSVQSRVPIGARGEGEFNLLGERIYAICYRKVSFKFFKGVDSAFLSSDNRWKSFSKTRGSATPEDEVIEADIEDMDDTGNCNFKEFATGDDGETFVCLLSEDEDEDEND